MIVRPKQSPAGVTEQDLEAEVEVRRGRTESPGRQKTEGEQLATKTHRDIRLVDAGQNRSHTPLLL